MTDVLVDAPAFMERLAEVCQKAKHSIYVQAMTFEGDSAGEQLMDILKSAYAPDKRICIDSYSKVVINDRFVRGTEYIKSSKFRKEVRRTRELIASAPSFGVEVKFTNPTGWLMQKYPLRNHKKMVVIDREICFIGGINFSDHNFQWHDFMIEIDDSWVANKVHEDFLFTWEGRNQSSDITNKEFRLFFLNGVHSRAIYNDLFKMITHAKSSIQVISPYVSDPLLGYLKESTKKGVSVSIFSPEDNNKSLFKDHLLRELDKKYFQFFLYQNGMSHLKAILIDDETLVFGSSNYDLISYHFEQEVVMAVSSPSLIASFKKKILEVDLFKSYQIYPGETKTRAIPSLILHFLGRLSRLASSSVLKPKGF
ncbi:MAG: phosphatidylserine/phosphatidylglycerophosphate/cardiolipin synthase family protein [Cyclobacteriaceae bacterium]|nr:phosphatidylserine/phosphatidylglycerophosphate/cardiolipin synthase family protein [Cyclobacteriaceae bacterium HetDA_MAG_MS6]